MNERSNDRFESLISAAVVDCVYQTADEFCAVDTSAVPSTPRLYKKVMKNLPGRKRTTVKTIIAVALIAAVLALTACACITEIREYFWRVVTEWQGDHFEVSFEKETATTEQSSADEESEVPSSIEQIAKLEYLPEGYYLEELLQSSSQYVVNCYKSSEWKYVFSQSIYDVTDSYMDSEYNQTIRVRVNDNDAILTEEHHDGMIYYNLVWQDDYYRYSLYGSFDSLAELLKTAENVNLNK